EVRAPRDRRADRRPRVPDRRARRAPGGAAAAARGRRRLPPGRRRGVACAARARAPAPARLRPRPGDGGAGGGAPMTVTSPRREGEERRERALRRPAPAPGRAPSLLDSFNYAVEGIIHVLRTQRNLRIHVAIAIGVLAAAIALGVERLELIALLLAI